VKINPNFKHKLVLFCGPSGSGKTTIVHSLLKAFPRMRFSISATTRPKRDNEVDGVDYYFLTPEQFRAKIANNEFLEWEEVYTDTHYGTLKSEVDRIWAKGKNVIFDIDVEGGLNLKNLFGDIALSVFVMPPSIKILEERLNIRSTDSTESISRRVAKAEKEIKTADLFDTFILNEVLEEAFVKAEKVVVDFLSK